MIGSFPAVSMNFNRLFFRLNRSICNQLPVLPHRCTRLHHFGYFSLTCAISLTSWLLAWVCSIVSWGAYLCTHKWHLPLVLCSRIFFSHILQCKRMTLAINTLIKFSPCILSTRLNLSCKVSQCAILNVKNENIFSLKKCYLCWRMKPHWQAAAVTLWDQLLGLLVQTLRV